MVYLVLQLLTYAIIMLKSWRVELYNGYGDDPLPPAKGLQGLLRHEGGSSHPVGFLSFVPSLSARTAV